MQGSSFLNRPGPTNKTIIKTLHGSWFIHGPSEQNNSKITIKTIQGSSFLNRSGPTDKTIIKPLRGSWFINRPYKQNNTRQFVYKQANTIYKQNKTIHSRVTKYLKPIYLQ